MLLKDWWKELAKIEYAKAVSPVSKSCVLLKEGCFKMDIDR